MKHIEVKVVGYSRFKSKKGNLCQVVNGIYIPEGDNNINGYDVFKVFTDPDLVVEVDQVYTALLGYDRFGKFGVIDILREGE